MTDEFNYFIVFYTLILGLAVTELLGGFARIVRAHALKKLDWQIALVALFTLISLCATWIDAWRTLKCVTINLEGVWAPVLVAICYYLAAAVIFPHDVAHTKNPGGYYHDRRRFIVGMFLAAEILVNVTYWNTIVDQFENQPAVFWFWFVPYNAAIEGAMIALLFATTRRWNIILLAALILLITGPYWKADAIRQAIVAHYHYPDSGESVFRCSVKGVRNTVIGITGTVQ